MRFGLKSVHSSIFPVESTSIHQDFMAYTYGRPFRYQKRRPSARGSAYRPTYSRSAVYPRRPAGGYSRYSRKKASRYGRPKTSKRMVVTPKNGFISGAPLSQYQLSQVDAFDPRSVGVKIPDSNTTPSCGIMVSDDLNLSVPGNNWAQCFAFQPSISTTMVVGPGASSSTWTWPINFGGSQSSAKYGSVAANYDLYRPVSHGVRISSSLSTTSATGFVHIAVYPSRTTKSTWDFPTSLALMSECMWYTRITVSSLTQTPYVIQNKFLDCTAQRYIDTNDSTNRQGDNPTGTGNTTRAGVFNVANEWCTILIAIEGAAVGAAVTNPISAETLVHYEALPSPGGVQAGNPAAHMDPQDLQGASSIAAQIDPVQQVSPSGQSSSIRAATAVLQATGNLMSDIGSNLQTPVYNALLSAGTAVGTQYINQRGAQATNNIGMLQG